MFDTNLTCEAGLNGLKILHLHWHQCFRLQDFVEVKEGLGIWKRAAEGCGQVCGEETELADLQRRSFAIASVEGLLLSFFTLLRHTSLCSPSPSPNLM